MRVNTRYILNDRFNHVKVSDKIQPATKYDPHNNGSQAVVSSLPATGRSVVSSNNFPPDETDSVNSNETPRDSLTLTIFQSTSHLIPSSHRLREIGYLTITLSTALLSRRLIRPYKKTGLDWILSIHSMVGQPSTLYF